MLESLTGLSGCMVSPNVSYHMRYHGETDHDNFLPVSNALERTGWSLGLPTLPRSSSPTGRSRSLRQGSGTPRSLDKSLRN
jgi:hypothetical protein